MARLVRLVGCVFAVIGLSVGPAPAAQSDDAVRDVVTGWNRLILELVRHTPTYSPPVASRAFAYLGVTAYEAAASGTDELETLAGQLNELTPLPQRASGADYDEAIVMHAALSFGADAFFGNTGPTGQRAMDAMETHTADRVAQGVDAQVAERSTAFGTALGEHILAWSLSDGGAVVDNLGFPHDYRLTDGAEHWVPTNRVAVQQTPLLPDWGTNRTFAMPENATCTLGPPPAYSEEPGSRFYAEAVEVRDAVANLTPEQEEIARFWSDDPMLSPTPPGHWLSIALDIMERDDADLLEQVDVLARLGIVLADAFIGCWHDKYAYDLVRPVTYINRLIDAEWEPILTTPPFPEYPSGHSTQSGAAAGVLQAYFGHDFAFADDTHSADGLPVRHYESFWQAAEEAAISRLYGGIHFRAAIERGLEQGVCIAAYTNALKTRN